MLGRDENLQSGFVDFPKFTQGLCFSRREAISEARELSKTCRWDFAKAVIQGWIILCLEVLTT